jgi:hypothetical protein
VEKYGTDGQATNDNVIWRMRFACYTHLLRICNVYFFSTATMIKRACLNVTFIGTLPLLLIPGKFLILSFFINEDRLLALLEEEKG